MECLANIKLKFYYPFKWSFHYFESTAVYWNIYYHWNFNACVKTFK